MVTHSETRSADRKVEKERLNHGRLEKGFTHEIEDIKENIVGLARNIRDVSAHKAHDAADYVYDRVDDLKSTGAEAMNKVETRIKAKPGQSVAIAFVAGMLTSLLFGRRPS